MQHQTANYPIPTATYSFTPTHLYPSTLSKKRKINECSGYEEGQEQRFGNSLKRLLRTQSDCKEAEAVAEDNYSLACDSTFESVVHLPLTTPWSSLEQVEEEGTLDDPCVRDFQVSEQQEWESRPVQRCREPLVIEPYYKLMKREEYIGKISEVMQIYL